MIANRIYIINVSSILGNDSKHFYGVGNIFLKLVITQPRCPTASQFDVSLLSKYERMSLDVALFCLLFIYLFIYLFKL